MCTYIFIIAECFPAGEREANGRRGASGQEVVCQEADAESRGQDAEASTRQPACYQQTTVAAAKARATATTTAMVATTIGMENAVPPPSWDFW